MKRPTIIALTGGLVVILVVAAVLVGKRWGTSQTTPPATTSASTTGGETSSIPTKPPTTPPNSSTSAPGCVSTPTASGNPITAAPATDWYIADTGQTLPKTKGGPFKMENRLALCYTPDSLGALTAAVNIRARMASDAWEQVARNQTQPAPTEQDIAEAKNSPDKQALARPFPAVTGFRMNSPIASNVVVVELHFQGLFSGQQADLRDAVTMVWTGTDWKQVSSEVTVASSGFIDWRP